MFKGGSKRCGLDKSNWHRTCQSLRIPLPCYSFNVVWSVLYYHVTNRGSHKRDIHRRGTK